MRGDQLASGAKSADFRPGAGISEEEFNKRVGNVKTEKKIFCGCTDCPTFVAYSSAEFFEHFQKKHA